MLLFGADDLDAFNDETFGGPLEVGGDWEQNHEQLAKLEEMEFGGEMAPLTQDHLNDDQGIKGNDEALLSNTTKAPIAVHPPVTEDIKDNQE